MEFLSLSAGGIQGFLSYLIPFLLVLTVIVFVHEMGHFLVARWCGVKVDVFAVGFGRRLASFVDRKGTRWQIGWIPLGGYVKFAGDMSAASSPDREALSNMNENEADGAFHNKSVAQRAAIVAGGPAANFLLSIVIFALTVMLVGRVVTAPIIDDIRPDSAAAVAEFKVGDLIKKVDGKDIESFSDLQRIVSINGGVELDFVVERNGGLVNLKATPRVQEIDDGLGNKIRAGILGITRNAQNDRVVEKYGPVKALGYGVEQTWFIIDRTFAYLGNVIGGREKADQIGGPIRIAQVTGQVASISFTALINLAAVLSVSIGLINLFPVPMLDGGHLMYYAIEAVRGKPLSARAQDYGLRVGLALVMMLMLFATFNDLRHLSIF
ncbi:MAG: RIP metalloprotease RseP [Pseudomonadota bacterium]